MIKYILARLEELTKDSNYKLGKYMLILETLSTNRDIKLEDSPSYQIVMERGFNRGISKGIINTATTMIKEFNLYVEIVAKKLNILIDELKKHLYNK